MASSAMTLSVAATGQSSVTTLSAHTAARLRERYGWRQLTLRRRLTGGYAEIYPADADGRAIDWNYQLCNMEASYSLA